MFLLAKSIKTLKNHEKQHTSSPPTLVNPYGGMTKQKTEWGLGDPTISIAGERFCNPYPMELIVKRRIQNLSITHFDVYDLSGNLLLQVDGNIWGLKRKRVMRDPAGFAVLTMSQKAITLKHKWKFYQGDNCDRDKLLFSAQQSNAVQIKTSFDVFLGNNLRKQVCNFHASGNRSNLSFKVYKGLALIAGVTHQFTWGNFCKGKDNFRVTVNPEVDYAFIVALLVVINDTENAV